MRLPEHEADEEPSLLKEVFITVAAAVLLALVVQQFLVKPYRIPSGSMENTLRCGDRVLVDRITYRFGTPERFDVVVFKPPAGIGSEGKPDAEVQPGGNESPSGDGEARPPRGTGEPVPYDEDYIKRIIGMPGEEIEVRGHRAYIDGQKLEEPFLFPVDDGVRLAGDFSPITIADDHYFVMGDHRDNSSDSRVFGTVPRDFLIGQAFMIYWPPSHAGTLPARDSGDRDAASTDPHCLESPAIGTPVPEEEAA